MKVLEKNASHMDHACIHRIDMNCGLYDPYSMNHEIKRLR